MLFDCTLISHNCWKIRKTVLAVLSDFILYCRYNEIIRLFFYLMIDRRCGTDIESEWSHLKPQDTTDLFLAPSGIIHNENLISFGLVAANSCKKLRKKIIFYICCVVK